MVLNTERIIPWPTVKPYDKQGVAVAGTKRPGQSAHYRNGVWGLIDEHTPNTLTTLDQVWADGLKVGANREFLGWRPIISQNPLKFAPTYSWLTYSQVDVRRKYVGSALHTLFQKGELAGDVYPTVGIWSQNRPEWQIIDIALQSYGKVGVSLYDTLGKDSVEYIVNHAALSVVFATADHVPTLLKLVPKTPVLKLVVSIDNLSAEATKVLKEWAASLNVRFLLLSELEEFGKENLVAPIPATPDTVASICYTSGTTNMPKGVVLLHKTLAVATQANIYGMDLPDDGILLSYLPLAHIYERICELTTIALGARIGFFTGDPLRLLEDASILRPHFFPSVPRVLNRVYQAAMAGGNVPGLKGNLFRKAVSVKIQKLRQTGDNTHALWDRLVFRKIQAVLGGRVQLVISGSAPISSDVMDFLKIAFSCEVLEGYGLTESSATCGKSWPEDSTSSGTVGPPAASNEVKVVDVPAMGYTAEDKPNPRGELCIRGANIFTHYFKDEKNTKESIDEEGWFHTGDVAEIDSAGRLKIVDRVKNIMKLSQGEYVALEKIENLYATVPVVAQIFVYGDGLQSYVVSVVVPDPVILAGIVTTITGKKVTPTDISLLEEAAQDPRVVAHVLAVLTKHAQRNGLKGFEMVKRLHITLSPFTVDENTLTPTMKLRRKDAYNKFKKEIDGLYSLGEPSSKL
ncbi:long-chain-fatty-acid-CoA ligase [Coprinopsis marcescibilis]|uniref:Long-chain-fatty-acid-CoA ligase n=1 Tax=Coprinopsis marcescibilis TaxID=230819 RepID=A0A5C3L9S6_COPMA|nr:long-chain-fatty-acid-CoA ligase [Coprinopsis marcescibilis]